MAFQAPAAPMGDGYPVQVTMTDAREINRLWGIPFLGIFVRYILAIPHALVLAIMMIGFYVWLFLGWIPILLLGRQPDLVVKFLTEFMHRGMRTVGYAIFLMPGGYPPLEPGAPTPLGLEVNVEGRSLNRLWGIPFFGIFVRYILLIPHLIVFAILAIVAYVSLIVLWIPILVTGKYPEAFASYYRSMFRYGSRVFAYLLLLPVPYPPFSLS